MTITLMKTPAETAYTDAFEPQGALAEKRKSAFAQFAEHGLPHRRMEDWKWTDLRQMISNALPPAHGTTAAAKDIDALIAATPFAGVSRSRLVFVDGAFDEARSTLPASGDVEFVTLGSNELPGWLSDSLVAGSTDPIAALNLAYMSDGAALRFSKGANADAPIELVFVTTATAAATYTTRNVIVLEEGASATVIETHIGGESEYVHNSVTQLHIGDKARLDRVKVQEEGLEGIHLSNTDIHLAASAYLKDFTLTMGAHATRQQGFVTFEGEHTESYVSGAYLLTGKQHCDTRLLIDHAVPNCTSRELFKCVMDGASRGIFQGKAIVRRDAQKTDGNQSSNALLLSDEAEFDAKPELEIYADDVVCGHGATSGDLDENHLFYLRTRGIPETQAKSMLIGAFAAEAFDDVESDAIREVLAGLAEGWLARRLRV
jgi:Fe-S cluster assembly protein SufD